MPRTRTIKETIYKYKELSEEAKENALQHLSNINICYDDWWRFDGSICDNDWMIFEGMSKVYFDIDRNWFIQFPDLKIKDKDLFCDLLNIPKRMRYLLYISIKQEHGSHGRGKTRVEFDWNGRHSLPSKYQTILDTAEEKFNDLMENTLCHIKKDYEYLTSREAIEETILLNEYEFFENGTLA